MANTIRLHVEDRETNELIFYIESAVLPPVNAEINRNGIKYIVTRVELDVNKSSSKNPDFLSYHVLMRDKSKSGDMTS